MKKKLSNGRWVMWGPYTRDELDELHDMGVHSPPIRVPSRALKPTEHLPLKPSEPDEDGN